MQYFSSFNVVVENLLAMLALPLLYDDNQPEEGRSEAMTYSSFIFCTNRGPHFFGKCTG